MHRPIKPQSLHATPRPLTPIAPTGRWIGLNKSIEVHGLTLPGGVYVGSGLKAATGLEEPSLINPTLPIAPHAIATKIEGYWPSYAALTPQCRRNYLDWLATGRKNPTIDIGYVFLYFYALERRAILDACMDVNALHDYPALAQELQRLLSIYGPRSKSFNKYASHLLEWVTLTNEKKTYTPSNLPNIASSLIKVKFALGQASQDAAPVPAKLMLAWAKTDSATFALRTPALRCPAQFDAVFETNYRQKFPTGLVIGKSQSKLAFRYQPASSGFSASPAISMGFNNIMDVGTIQKLVAIVQALVEETTVAIEPFSRYLARHPNGQQELEGLMLLPPYLWPTTMRQTLHALKRDVLKQPTSILCADLLNALGTHNNLNKERALALAQSLSTVGIGMEPDVHGAPKIVKLQDTLVLFELRSIPDHDRNDDAYSTALLAVQLACAVAQADGLISNEEQHYLQQRILRWKHLSDNHIERLRAHVQWRRTKPLRLALLNKQLDALTPQAKTSLLGLLAQWVANDKTMGPKEAQWLNKMHAALGLNAPAMKTRVPVNTAPKKDINNTARKTFTLDAFKIAKLQTQPSDPAGLLHIAASFSNGAALEEDTDEQWQKSPVVDTPAVSTPPKPRLQLDLAKIAALQKDTQAVDALLAGIFVQEADTLVPPQQPIAVLQERNQEQTCKTTTDTPMVLFETLDMAHNTFASLLLAQAQWSRDDAQTLAEQHDLMLDGALESLNDASFDAFGAPFAEGDDPIEINPDIKEHLQ